MASGGLALKNGPGKDESKRPTGGIKGRGLLHPLPVEIFGTCKGSICILCMGEFKLSEMGWGLEMIDIMFYP